MRILAIIKYKSIQLFHGRASLASQNFVILHKKIENIASFMNDPDAFYKFKLKVIEEINKIEKKQYENFLKLKKASGKEEKRKF